VTALELLAFARAHDITLIPHGDRLRVQAPPGTLTPEVRAELQAQKPALLAWLAPADRVVTLKGGLTVPVAAFLLALDLEARGIALAVDAEHEFKVPTDPRLLPADRAAIRRWRRHLGAIVEYRVPDEEVPQ